MEENAKTMKYVFNEDLFRKRLRAAMNAKGYNNAKLAKVAQVSPVTIGHYLGTRSNNTRTPRGIADIYPIAKALGVSLDYLFGLSDINRLDESKGESASYPQNYYDAVKMLNVLEDRFGATSNMSASTDDTVQLNIKDHDLAEFLRQQRELFNMLGGSLSTRAFTIAIDDLNEKMKEHQIPVDYCLSLWLEECVHGKGEE